MRRLLPLALLLAACSDPTSPAAGLRVVVDASPASFRSGDAVTVTISVTNVGVGTRVVPANQCPFQFVVRTPAGAAAGPGPQFCALSATSVTLKLGETFRLVHRWRGDVIGPADGSEPLAPGSYVLEATAPYQTARPAAITVLP